MEKYKWTLTVEVGKKKYDPSQPRVPAGSAGGGRWTSGSGGSSNAPQQSFFGTAPKVEPKTPELRTRGASVSYGIGGDQDTFKIRGPSGSYASGYWRNSDFPGEYGKPDRGELFFVTAGGKKRAGIGTSLARDALAVMKANGAQTVVMFPTTKEGGFLISKLVREGDIELIRSSDSGKAEYRISS